MILKWIERFYMRVFKDEYSIIQADNGFDAINVIEILKNDIDIMILDIVMPILSGFHVLERLKEENLLGDMPVVLITAESSIENVNMGYQLGMTDFVVKPFDIDEVKKRIDKVRIKYELGFKLNKENPTNSDDNKLNNSDGVDNTKEDGSEDDKEDIISAKELKAAAAYAEKDNIIKFYEKIVDKLCGSIDNREFNNRNHIKRIKLMTKELAQEVARTCPMYRIKEKDIDAISRASVFHDIGKISIDKTLLKKVELSYTEIDIRNKHTLNGSKMIDYIKQEDDEEDMYLDYIKLICEYHHEYWDGSGYPNGIKEDSIPICAQIVGMVIHYDFLTRNIMGKIPDACEKAEKLMINGSDNTKFSARMITCFENVKDLLAEIASRHRDRE